MRDVEAGLEPGVAGELAEDGLSRLTPVAGLEPSDPSTTAGGPARGVPRSAGPGSQVQVKRAQRTGSQGSTATAYERPQSGTLAARLGVRPGAGDTRNSASSPRVFIVTGSATQERRKWVRP